MQQVWNWYSRGSVQRKIWVFSNWPTFPCKSIPLCLLYGYTHCFLAEVVHYIAIMCLANAMPHLHALNFSLPPTVVNKPLLHMTIGHCGQLGLSCFQASECCYWWRSWGEQALLHHWQSATRRWPPRSWVWCPDLWLWSLECLPRRQWVLQSFCHGQGLQDPLWDHQQIQWMRELPLTTLKLYSCVWNTKLIFLDFYVFSKIHTLKAFNKFVLSPCYSCLFAFFAAVIRIPCYSCLFAFLQLSSLLFSFVCFCKKALFAFAKKQTNENSMGDS